MQHQVTILMGLKSKMLYDLIFEMLFYKVKLKYFDTSTQKALDYVELTPFNKGSLWKIRKFYKYYHVYYGTVKVAYCTNISSVYKIISK